MGMAYFERRNHFLEYIASAAARPPVVFPPALIIENTILPAFKNNNGEDADG